MNDPSHPSRQNGGDQDLDSEKAIERERGTIVTTVRAASSEALREHVRLHSFRNIVVVTAALMALLAVGVAPTGFFRPNLGRACFSPQEGKEAVVVCPANRSGPFIPLKAGAEPHGDRQFMDIDDGVEGTAKRGDLIIVELVGLTAAAIATAAAISRIKGSSERYGLPVALAALKLPTGAITAFLGLLTRGWSVRPGPQRT
jgi:hypothetical protein